MEFNAAEYLLIVFGLILFVGILLPKGKGSGRKGGGGGGFDFGDDD